MLSENEIKLFKYFGVEVEDNAGIFWYQHYNSAIVNAFVYPFKYSEEAKVALRRSYIALCIEGINRNTPEYEGLITW